jgi:hypothetical protein
MTVFVPISQVRHVFEQCDILIQQFNNLRFDKIISKTSVPKQVYRNDYFDEFQQIYGGSNIPIYKKLCRMIETWPMFLHFNILGPSQKRYITTNLAVEINVNIPLVLEEVNELLQSSKLSKLSEYDINCCHHFAILENDKIVSYIAYNAMRINSNFGVAISIDKLVSTKRHDATILLSDLKANALSRKHKSFIFTQGTKSSSKFWKGKMSESSMCSLLIVLFHMYHINAGYDYLIFSDTYNYCISNF